MIVIVMVIVVWRRDTNRTAINARESVARLEEGVFMGGEYSLV